MHGLVCLDHDNRPLLPAMIWMDNRSKRQIKEIYEIMTETEIAAILHNRPFPGFAFPSLLYVKENRPEIFDKIKTVLLPKDYIRYKMTGEIGTDNSDASSTTMFDLAKREWSKVIMQKFALPPEIFPRVAQGSDVAGYITEACTRETGLPKGACVVYGAGDQPAQSVGNGCVIEGYISSSIGTSGQMATYSVNDKYDKQMRVHTFNHAVSNAYVIFGAILTAGATLKWLKNNILKIDTYHQNG